jgi:hypothetical protein
MPDIETLPSALYLSQLEVLSVITMLSVAAVGNNKYMNNIIRKTIRFVNQNFFHCKVYIIWLLPWLSIRQVKIKTECSADWTKYCSWQHNPHFLGRNKQGIWTCPSLKFPVSVFWLVGCLEFKGSVGAVKKIQPLRMDSYCNIKTILRERTNILDEVCFERFGWRACN